MRSGDADERTPDVVLIGGGGHARVLVDAWRAAGDARTIGVVDADRARTGGTVLDAPVLGDDALLPELFARGTRFFAVAVGGTRGEAPRRALYERALALGFAPVAIVHPQSMVSAWAQLGAGAQVLPGAIINAGARLGANVIVNSGAIVEHDCTLGDHVHVATGARLASAVVVGDGAHVGAGAVVRQLVRIGANAVVAAGAVVVKDVAPSALVAGVPAKELGR